eukprot:15463411-Alexandrium_andersonii.AAC.1
MHAARDSAIAHAHGTGRNRCKLRTLHSPKQETAPAAAVDLSTLTVVTGRRRPRAAADTRCPEP